MEYVSYSKIKDILGLNSNDVDKQIIHSHWFDTYVELHDTVLIFLVLFEKSLNIAVTIIYWFKKLERIKQKLNIITNYTKKFI